MPKKFIDPNSVPKNFKIAYFLCIVFLTTLLVVGLIVCDSCSCCK